MGCGAAEGLLCHPKEQPRWPPSCISLKTRTYQKRLKLNFCARHVEYFPMKTSVQFVETSGNLTITVLFRTTLTWTTILNDL